MSSMTALTAVEHQSLDRLVAAGNSNTFSMYTSSSMTVQPLLTVNSNIQTTLKWQNKMATFLLLNKYQENLIVFCKFPTTAYSAIDDLDNTIQIGVLASGRMGVGTHTDTCRLSMKLECTAYHTQQMAHLCKHFWHCFFDKGSTCLQLPQLMLKGRVVCSGTHTQAERG